MTMKIKFATNLHTQILNTIYLQYKGISKSVLIIQNVRFSAIKITLILLKLGFIKFSRHQLCTTTTTIIIIIIIIIITITVNLCS
jgi:hypothetical protein